MIQAQGADLCVPVLRPTNLAQASRPHMVSKFASSVARGLGKIIEVTKTFPVMVCKIFFYDRINLIERQPYIQWFKGHSIMTS
jgi:hypothetical protein